MSLTIGMRMFNNVKHPHAVYLKFGGRCFTSLGKDDLALTILGLES